jgi:sortase A
MRSANNKQNKTKRKPSKFISSVYNFITGLAAAAFISLIVYFIGYPILPELKNIKDEVYRYNPYDLAYKFTIQSFFNLTPPNQKIEASQPDADQPQNASTDSGSQDNNQSMENVDAKGLELSDLEKHQTQLSIPAASIKGKVVVGFKQDTMLRGFWHFPPSSVPAKRGNTVIFGHRFDKIPPETETFYNLDKVEVGDKIYINQKNKDTISYTVVNTKVVEKNNSEVLEQTGDYRLTLITCTPLWSDDKRLIVIALRDQVSHAV